MFRKVFESKYNEEFRVLYKVKPFSSYRLRGTSRIKGKGRGIKFTLEESTKAQV